MKDNRKSESEKKNWKGPKVSRRTFLKVSALTGLALGVSGGRKESRPLPLPSPQAESQKAREEKWISTSCLNCPSRCGIRVRVVNGRAVQIVGNERSLVSEGKICPRAHIGLQVLYDQGRILSPLKRIRSEKRDEIDPKWQPISWNQALDEICSRLKLIRDRQHPQRLLLFSGLNSRSSEDLLLRFANGLGTPNVISGDGLDQETEKSGNWMADGHYAACAYDLDHTNYMLSFGGDFLESSQPVSRFLRKWGRLRREKPNRTKVVVIQPRYSLTAAKSDEWIPIQPGTDAALALALAHVIIKEGLYDEAFVREWTSGFDRYRQLVLERYQPEVVSKTTDISVETIYRIAREFAQTRPALALRGRGAIDWSDGSYISYAIYCLNALVGSIDAPGGVLYQEEPGYQDMPNWSPDEISGKGLEQPPLDFRGSERFPIAKVVTNQVPESLLKELSYAAEMAIGFQSNFNMTAPGAGQWGKALKKIPYYVHVSPFLSEMARFADLVLPSTVFLEEWGYDHSPPGSGFAEARIKQPVVKPKGEARSVSDILFHLADRLGGAIAKSLSGMGGDAEGFVRLRTASLLPWGEFLSKGVWTGQSYRYRKYHKVFSTPSKKFEFSSGNLRSLDARMGKKGEEEHSYAPRYKEAKFLGAEAQYPLILFPYQPLLVIENGSQNYPWAQEIFLPMQGVGWVTPAEINAETGRSLNLKDRDEVWIESPFGKIRTRIKLSEGVHPKIVSIPWGQGHTSYGKWQQGIGCNPNEIIGVDFDPLSGQAAFFNTRVKVYKV
jgi:thiosulfate reductase / polysulfide reductase chain A